MWLCLLALAVLVLVVRSLCRLVLAREVRAVPSL
jgi:hypothetical protein